jgi:uncharacterized membrane protein YbhN (UPF0104 family)
VSSTQVTQFVGTALERVSDLDPRYLAAALGLQLLILVCRSLAWRNILAAAYPDRRVPVFGLGCSYAAGVAVNAFTPARGGEVAKVGLARTQIPGSTVPTVAASLSIVMILDTIIGATLIVLLWAVGALPALPLPALTLNGPSIVIGAAAVLLLASATAAGIRSGRARRALRNAAQGLTILRTPRRYLVTVVPFQLAAWACRVGVILLVLAAYHVHAGLDTALLLVVLGGLSTVVPVPGGGGAQQLLATYALQGTLSAAGAVSFSLSMQATVTVVNLTVGLAATMLLFRTLRPLTALRAARTARR